MAQRFWRWCSILLVLPVGAAAQFGSLRASIPPIAHSIDGVVGVAVIDTKTGDTLTVNGDRRFPMQSVYKFPIAAAVLDRVDRGALALSQVVHVTAADLLPNTWSPLREAHPAGNVDLTLDSIVAATVSLSDNNGCDILLWMLDGPPTVDRFVRGLGIDGMAIVATEEEMHRSDEVQYRNFSTPMAMAQLLRALSEGTMLSSESRAYLWDLMAGSPTGARRLKGRLPAHAVVAHKTGSSGVNAQGIAAATNDAGILVLPDGRRVVVVVFVSDSKAAEPEREAVIAKIARTVWDALAPRSPK